MATEQQRPKIRSYRIKPDIRQVWVNDPAHHTNYIPELVHAFQYTGSEDCRLLLRDFVGTYELTHIGQPIVKFATGNMTVLLGCWIIKNIDDDLLFMWKDENFQETFEEVNHV